MGLYERQGVVERPSLANVMAAPASSTHIISPAGFTDGIDISAFNDYLFFAHLNDPRLGDDVSLGTDNSKLELRMATWADPCKV